MERVRAWLRHEAVCALSLVFALCGAAHAGTHSDLVQQAVAYEHGEGVPKDQLKAATLYCEAARAGDAEAQYALGWMYTHGRGVPRDDGLAHGLFQLAVAQGHEYAERALRFVRHAEPRLPECMTPPAPPKLAALREGLPAHRLEIVELVERLAPRFDIDPALALAVIAVESNFDARARSPRNAQGLMQLIPATAQRFKVRDAYDPAENVKGGLAYLRWLLSYYRGQVELAIAAYNAGEGAVDRHGGVPPYAETRAYVRKVLELYEAQTHPYDASLAQPSPVLRQQTARM
ncbi:MAG: transglycosylase SLT domain-containing protein [Burkholderiales bacterium]|nr:transglycosylase SLT domain-containing protein [Burkholderiales bacterium]